MASATWNQFIVCLERGRGKGKGKGEEVAALGRKALVVERGSECRGERNCWMDGGYVWQL